MTLEFCYKLYGGVYNPKLGDFEHNLLVDAQWLEREKTCQRKSSRIKSIKIKKAR